MASKNTENIFRTNMNYCLDDGLAWRARIGLVVLATDHTIEYEFKENIKFPGVGLYQSRILMSPKVSKESLKAMEPLITDSVNTILPGQPLDVVAYACTSATTIIGEDRVFELLNRAKPMAKTTSPITGAIAGLKELGCNKIGVLTPYNNNINHNMRSFLEAKGFEVPIFGSFNLDDDNKVARISTESIFNAILDLGLNNDVDAVFVSCTSLRLIHAITEIEAMLGKPVISSNQALIWHSLRLAGINDTNDNSGKLFQH